MKIAVTVQKLTWQIEPTWSPGSKKKTKKHADQTRKSRHVKSASLLTFLSLDCHHNSIMQTRAVFCLVSSVVFSSPTVSLLNKVCCQFYFPWTCCILYTNQIVRLDPLIVGSMQELKQKDVLLLEKQPGFWQESGKLNVEMRRTWSEDAAYTNYFCLKQTE